MTILVDKNTRVLVQGITGREGSFHTKMMLEYGTKVIAGVTPGKGGLRVHGVPVYDSVEEALAKHPEINTSIIFVPAPYASDAVYEAIDAGIKLIVVITEHIPVHDAMKFINYARMKGSIIIGPNTPGIISPGEAKVGIMPAHMFTKGPIGVISRSGTLTYEIAYALTKAGFGQSTCVGIGGDPIVGLDFIEVAEMFRSDSETKALVLIGEIGGNLEEVFADYVLKKGYDKPIVAFIAGKTAPPGKRMGHAGAIISMGTGTAQSKIEALTSAGIPVAEKPSDIPKLLARVMKG
ncbi:MAG TPA: succinate--CoA ligase subunit alpha [Desulfurococcales archaeon]|nr:succinate--CoA ligase subunit alpha [Desulfurococcales archaeon]